MSVSGKLGKVHGETWRGQSWIICAGKSQAQTGPAEKGCSFLSSACHSGPGEPQTWGCWKGHSNQGARHPHPPLAEEEQSVPLSLSLHLLDGTVPGLNPEGL